MNFEQRSDMIRVVLVIQRLDEMREKSKLTETN